MSKKITLSYRAKNYFSSPTGDLTDTCNTIEINNFYKLESINLARIDNSEDATVISWVEDNKFSNFGNLVIETYTTGDKTEKLTKIATARTKNQSVVIDDDNAAAFIGGTPKSILVFRPNSG